MDLPVTASSWLLAFLPLAILLALMLGARWGVAEAGPVAWLIAVVIAFTYFEAPMELIGFESAQGSWSAITVLYVVWASILIYEVTEEGGAFEPLRRGIARLLPHPLLQVLAFGWAFASFLQGVTGFGVPVAVCAPLLLGIGVRPLYAVIIPLIGHAWNNTFGTLAVAWLGLKEVTNLEGAAAAETALYAAAFIWVLNLLGGFLVCWLYKRTAGIREGLPVIIVMSLLQGGLTLALSQWNDVLNGFIASSVAFAAIFLLARLPMYRKEKPFDSDIFRDDIRQESGQPQGRSAGEPAPGSAGTGRPADAQPALTRDDQPEGTGAQALAATEEERPAKAKRELSLNQAFIPYYALVVITFGILLVPRFKEGLSLFTVTLSFPAAVTGLGFESEASEATVAPFVHAGTFLLLAALIAYAVFTRLGRMTRGSAGRIGRNTVAKSVPSTIAVIALIAMSNVMAGSGMVDVLAHGVANVTGDYYGLLAPLIGGLGAFMTTSNLASNLLFGQFQLSTAQAAGLSTAAILGAQTAGGAAGNMIAPGNVLLGTTTTGILGQEGAVLRVTIPLFLMVSAIIGVVVYFVA
ncbi:MAG TPA: L-lactate permease [Nocardioidaceae bacterium]|nr:L-lactate permease [Nocardioidaceae bacterium]